MPPPTAGSALLSCQTTLEHKPSSPLMTAQDGYLLYTLAFATRAVEGSRLISCLFHHFQKDGKQTLANSVYNILATMGTCVVERPAREHIDGPQDDVGCVKLYGTIVELKPVSLDEAYALRYKIIPARLIVTGLIHLVDASENTFEMTIYQYVDGGSFNDKLTVIVKRKYLRTCSVVVGRLRGQGTGNDC
ncbi:hypothetical protein EDB84DRAFT_1447114 [Lactarius hengduanensis]|nr:hypothetical protein EDB84DRAFT_1447114 [Lactarius hengduanensis]